MLKQKTHRNTSYGKQMMEIIDLYVAETGKKTYDLHDVASWAYRKDLLQPRPRNIINDLA